MVTKSKIVSMEIKETYCDTCGSVGRSHNWMYQCDACGKDICEKCVKYFNFSNGTYLTLCKDCITKDFTEYVNTKQEMICLEAQVDAKRDELDVILEKIKQG